MSVSQAGKLGIKPGHRIALVRQPVDWQLSDPPVPLEQVGAQQPADLVIAFHHEAAELAGMDLLTRRIFPDGALWIAWPRRAAGHRSDITDVVVRETALPLGVVDNKVAAIDDDWSGLRFVWRVALRR